MRWQNLQINTSVIAIGKNHFQNFRIGNKMYTYGSRLACAARDPIFLAIQFQFFPNTRRSFQTSADREGTGIFQVHTFRPVIFHDKFDTAAIIHPGRITGTALFALYSFQQKFFRQFIIIQYWQCRLCGLTSHTSFQQQHFQSVGSRLTVTGQTSQADIIESIAGKYAANNTHWSKAINTGHFYTVAF